MSKLLSSLPVGAKVKDVGTRYNGKDIVWQVGEHGHAGDPANSTMLVSEKILSLKAFDAIEAGNSDSNRRSYGNNRYLLSNYLQWMNSDAPAGQWYAAKHSADAPPTNANVWSNYNEYDQEAGFLAGFTPQMKAALLTVNKITAKNTVTDGGGYETVASKIFLLSTTEVGLANENNIAEGSIYALFSNSANRIKYPTAEAVAKSEYTNSNLAATKAWYYYLRTPYSGDSCGVRGVDTSGALGNGYAYFGANGFLPACAIPSSTLVSDSTDSDGCYTIMWNAAPVINTDSTVIGDKNTPFNVQFNITDADGDAVTATVKLDSTVKQTIGTVVLGQTYTYNLTAATLKELSLGAHTITVTATDTANNVTTKTFTFTKIASSVVISGEDGDLGTLWMQPEIKYTVGETAGKTVSVTEKIDGETVRTIEDAALDTEIVFQLDFDNLGDEEVHTLTIVATNGDGGTASREITFTKIASALAFYTVARVTDEAAKKIIVDLRYDNTGNPDVKIEVTNNALAISPVWEDATDAWKNHEAYTFVNTPESDFGIAIKVTLTKNANTERVYITGFGFSFS